MRTAVELEVVGERLEARGDLTLYWPAEATLFVADLHLGKGAAFRAGGVPVPAGSTLSTLNALSQASEATGTQRIVVLGDLWHARAGRSAENEEAFTEWRRGRELLLVMGNHDRHAGGEPDAIEPGQRLGPFVLRHYPDPHPEGYVLSGHLHPGLRLGGRGGDSLRLPCFWFGERVGVLPAFGDLTGTAEIRPQEGDRAVVAAEGKAAFVPIGDRFSARRR